MKEIFGGVGFKNLIAGGWGLASSGECFAEYLWQLMQEFVCGYLRVVQEKGSRFRSPLRKHIKVSDLHLKNTQSSGYVKECRRCRSLRYAGSLSKPCCGYHSIT